MQETMADSTPSVNDEVIEWRAFLTDRPVGARSRVEGAARKIPHDNSRVTVYLPDLELECIADCKDMRICKGQSRKPEKIFIGISQHNADLMPPFDAAITYSCEKCGKEAKSYLVRYWKSDDVQKLAEWPLFAPRTPGKVISLLGPDREMFLKGRRAEITGLGIGAYGYYRRIIENQKNRLLDEIIRVARHVGASEDAIAVLEKGKSENQFSKAVDLVKTAIPQELYIKSHNPLTLLHSALSEGLHDGTDEACLRAATDIRLILTEFAKRLAEAMTEEKELNDALGRLVNRKR